MSECWDWEKHKKNVEEAIEKFHNKRPFTDDEIQEFTKEYFEVCREFDDE